jgi:hypothetical protein
VGDGEQGAVAGVNASAQGLARFLGPLVGSQLYQISGVLPYGIATVLLFAVFGFVVVSRDVARTQERAVSAT